MKKLSLYFLIFLSAISLYGQESACYLEYFHYEGSFGQSEATIDLLAEEDKLIGFCNFYEPFINKNINSEPIFSLKLIGSIDEYGVAILKAFTTNKEIGIFTGHARQSFNGTFRSTRSSAVIPFEFSTEYKYDKPIDFKAYCLKKDSSLTDTAIRPSANLEMNILLPPDDGSNTELKMFLFEYFGWKDTDTAMDNESIIEYQATLFFSQYIESNKELFDRGASSNWEKSIRAMIELNYKDLLVYRTDNYAYTGGAHGLGITRFLVYDAQQQQKIELEDIFKNGNESELSELLDSKYREIHLLDTLQSLSEAGLYVETILPTENFLINGSGIGFYYNPYKIAPYAMGSQFIMLPWSELIYLIKEESSIWRIINR